MSLTDQTTRRIHDDSSNIERISGDTDTFKNSDQRQYITTNLEEPNQEIIDSPTTNVKKTMFKQTPARHTLASIASALVAEKMQKDANQHSKSTKSFEYNSELGSDSTQRINTKQETPVNSSCSTSENNLKNIKLERTSDLESLTLTQGSSRDLRDVPSQLTGDKMGDYTHDEKLDSHGINNPTDDNEFDISDKDIDWNSVANLFSQFSGDDELILPQINCKEISYKDNGNDNGDSRKSPVRSASTNNSNQNKSQGNSSYIDESLSTVENNSAITNSHGRLDASNLALKIQQASALRSRTFGRSQSLLIKKPLSRLRPSLSQQANDNNANTCNDDAESANSSLNDASFAQSNSFSANNNSSVNNLNLNNPNSAGNNSSVSSLNLNNPNSVNTDVHNTNSASTNLNLTNNSRNPPLVRKRPPTCTSSLYSVLANLNQQQQKLIRQQNDMPKEVQSKSHSFEQSSLMPSPAKKSIICHSKTSSNFNNGGRGQSQLKPPVHIDTQSGKNSRISSRLSDSRSTKLCIENHNSDNPRATLATSRIVDTNPALNVILKIVCQRLNANVSHSAMIEAKSIIEKFTMSLISSSQTIADHYVDPPASIPSTSSSSVPRARTSNSGSNSSNHSRPQVSPSDVLLAYKMLKKSHRPP